AALATMLAAVALATGRPSEWLIDTLSSKRTGAVVTRWLLPAAMVVPIAVGWMRLYAEREGLFGEAFGMTLFTIVMIAWFSSLILWVARTLDQAAAQRAQAEGAATEQREWLQVTLASIGDGVVATDAAGRVRFLNAAAQRLTAWRAAEAAGRPLDELFRLFDERDGAKLRNPLNAALAMRSAAAAGGEPALRARDGTVHPVTVNAAPILDGDGLLGAVLVLREVSAQRQSERAMREAYTELDQRVVRRTAALERASAALRERNALRGWSHLMATTRPLDGTLVERAAKAIKRNVDHQTRLIDDLLDTSRIVSGKLTLERRVVNLADIVLASLDASRPGAAAKQIDLRFTPGDPATMVIGDAGRLQQLVSNLLANAVKFTPDGGAISVQLHKNAERVQLQVKDNGIGIAPEFLPHVFDRFTQADTSASRRPGGLGIGLALVRHIALLHGGQVRADSAGPGKGATFTVDLPGAPAAAMLAIAKEPPEDRRRSTAGALRALKVWVADDDVDAHEVVALTLRQAGAHVECFNSGRALVAALEAALPTRGPHVLLIDLAMPGEDGFEALRRARSVELAC